MAHQRRVTCWLLLGRGGGWLAVLLLLGCSAGPVQAWNGVGHEVVGRIAWDNMTTQARRKAVDLMLTAPDNSQLRTFFSRDGNRPVAEREREFFYTATTWSDFVRPGSGKPPSLTQYHKRDWHFINFFWRQSNGTAQDDPRPTVGEILDRLQSFSADLTRSTDPAEHQDLHPSLKLAWLLHLSGDVHQPLHASARITRSEPNGDKGGNDFKLNGNNNLHSYWDNIIEDTFRRRRGESEDDYINRLAGTAVVHHPKSEFDDLMQPGEFRNWAQGSLRTAQEEVYPSTLRRNRKPSARYAEMAYQESEQAVALAGYRLAMLMNAIFDS